MPMRSPVDVSIPTATSIARLASAVALGVLTLLSPWGAAAWARPDHYVVEGYLAGVCGLPSMDVKSEITTSYSTRAEVDIKTFVTPILSYWYVYDYVNYYWGGLANQADCGQWQYWKSSLDNDWRLGAGVLIHDLVCSPQAAANGRRPQRFCDDYARSPDPTRDAFHQFRSATVPQKCGVGPTEEVAWYGLRVKVDSIDLIIANYNVYIDDVGFWLANREKVVRPDQYDALTLTPCGSGASMCPYLPWLGDVPLRTDGAGDYGNPPVADIEVPAFGQNTVRAMEAYAADQTLRALIDYYRDKPIGTDYICQEAAIPLGDTSLPVCRSNHINLFWVANVLKAMPDNQGEELLKDFLRHLTD